MTTVIRLTGDNTSSRRFFAPAAARLAVALALSVLVHLWFATGTAVDIPSPPTLHGRMITVRLEMSVTSSPSQLKRQTETEGTEKSSFEDSQPGRPVHDIGPGFSGTNRSTAPRPAAGVPALRAVSALPRQVEAVYYSARQLDVYPALLHPVRPEYPEQHSQGRAGGKVRVTLLIDETGRVNEVSTAEAEPAGDFEDAVRRAFASARFSPARKDGQAVKSRVLISVTYGPGEAEGAR